MEKNTVNMSAEILVSEGNNLYPDLPDGNVAEAPEREPFDRFAKPALISKDRAREFSLCNLFYFLSLQKRVGYHLPFLRGRNYRLCCLYYQKVRYFLERRAYFNSGGKPYAGHFKLFHRQRQDYPDE